MMKSSFLRAKPIKKLPKLPPLSDNLHKGSAGKIAIIGGSQGMSGAIVMAARAALRCGAGLVTCIVPDCIGDLVDSQNLETMTKYTSSSKGVFSPKAFKEIAPLLEDKDFILLGPGMGREPHLAKLTQALINTNLPFILDADALFHLSLLKQPINLNKCILTPHMGEMARLTNQAIKETQEERLKIAETFTKQNHCTLVLKSHETIVMQKDLYYIENKGNPGMATGGMGDVLAGTITALQLVPGLDPFMKTCIAVSLHSYSADTYCKNKSMRSLLPSDIINEYPFALRKWES